VAGSGVVDIGEGENLREEDAGLRIGVQVLRKRVRLRFQRLRRGLEGRGVPAKESS
jgi:hypothetical protein